MLYTVYILFSEKHRKIYIGYTSNLINRFHSHNELSKKDWTRNFRPWMVIYCEYFYDCVEDLIILPEVSKDNRETKELKSFSLL